VRAGHERALAGGDLPWSDLCGAVAELKRTCPGARVSVMTSSQLIYTAERAALLPPVDGILVTDIAWDQPSRVPLSSPRVWFLSQGVVRSDDFPPPPEPISMVYLTRVQGVTGAGQRAAGTTAEAIARIRARTDVDVWLGFGVTSRADLDEAAAFGADGAVVGSAFVDALARQADAFPPGLSAAARKRALADAAGAWVERLVHAPAERRGA